MKAHAYTVQIEPIKDGGYWSRVPALPGCFSQGETIEDTILHTKEAIELYIEGLVAGKQDIPEESEELMSVKVPVTV